MHVPYTEEAYFKLGRNVTRVFLDFYKLDSSVTTKPKFQRRPAVMKPRFSEDESSGSDEQQSRSEMDDSLTQLNSQTSSSSIDSNGVASLKLTHRKSK